MYETGEIKKQSLHLYESSFLDDVARDLQCFQMRIDATRFILTGLWSQ